MNNEYQIHLSNTETIYCRFIIPTVKLEKRCQTGTEYA